MLLIDENTINNMVSSVKDGGNGPDFHDRVQSMIFHIRDAKKQLTCFENYLRFHQIHDVSKASHSRKVKI